MFSKTTAVESSMNLIQVKQDEQGEKIVTFIFEMSLMLALSVGFWFTLFSMFPNPANQILTISLIILLPIALYFLMRIPFIGRYLIFYSFMIAALFILFFYKTVWNGLLVYANIAVEILNEQLSLGMIGYEIAGDSSTWGNDAMMAFVPAVIIVSAAVSHSVYFRESTTGLVITSLPVIICLCMKAVPSIWVLALLILGWVGLYVLSAVSKPISRKKNKPVYIQSQRYFTLPIIFLLVMIFILLVYVLLFSDENYSPPQSIEQVRSYIVEKEEHLRFDNLSGDKTDSLSQGDLTKTHPLSYTENQVLEVRMDVPQSMYLRGFSGGFYEDDKWLASEDWPYSGEYKGLTQWLAKNRFYPWCQLDNLYRMSDDYDIVDADIENMNASSKYTYIPYETAMVGDVMPDKVNYYRDSALYSKGLRGDREYSFTMFIPKFNDYDSESIESWAAELGNKKEFSDYLSKEEVYRRFVYDTYLYISDDGEKAMNSSRKLINDISGKDIDTILYAIRNEFTLNYTYDLESEPAPDGESELGYFMNESKTGNDMYFATAATHLFRKAGIPARYVEGYYISPDRVKLYTEMDNVKISVPDSYSHAWVEIYVDKIGWIPVETIPGFFTLEKKESEQEESSQETTTEKEKSVPRETPVDEDYDDTGQKEKNFNPWWLILPLILIMIAGYEIVGRYRANKLRASFGVIHTDRTVYEMYRYISRLMKFDGNRIHINPYENINDMAEKYDEYTDFKFAELLEVVNAVRFGNKTLPDETHKKLANYTRQLSAYIYKKQTGIKKFLMRFVFFYV